MHWHQPQEAVVKRKTATLNRIQTRSQSLLNTYLSNTTNKTGAHYVTFQ